MKSSKVFISYSHDSEEHRERVLQFAQRLRTEGVQAIIDRFEQSPAEGWPRWMQRQVQDSEFVLIVCTARYKLRFDGIEEPGKGLGANWEGFVTYQMLYDDAALNRRFIPVLMGSATLENIPTILAGATRYRVPEEYDQLYRRLTGQPDVTPAELGLVRKLPAVETAVVRSQGAPSASSESPSAPQPDLSWKQIEDLMTQHRPHSRDRARIMWAQLRQRSSPPSEALAAVTAALLRPGISDDEAYSLARLVTSEPPGEHIRTLSSALLSGSLDASPRTALHVAYSALALSSEFERMLKALEEGAPTVRDDILLSAMWLALEQGNAEAQSNLDRIEEAAKRYPTNSNARRIYLRLTGRELNVPVRPNEAERFEALRRDARAAMSKLDKVVREALYYSFRHEVYSPPQDFWDDAQRGQEEGTLKYDEDERGFRPDDRDPAVRKALDALKRLDGFLSDDASAELVGDYETENSVVVDMQRRPFWRKLGL